MCFSPAHLSITITKQYSSYSFKMVRSAVFLVLIVAISVGSVSSQFVYQLQKFYEGSSCQSADGRKGICSLNCTTLTPTQRQDRRNVCGSEKNIVMVCCPRKSVDRSSLYPTLEQTCIDRTQTLEERIRTAIDIEERAQYEQQKHREYDAQYQQIFPTRVAEILTKCEREASAIGGDIGRYYGTWCKSLNLSKLPLMPSDIYPAVLNEHPHMAALGWFTDDNTTVWNCGGALIHPKFVLTAAHCIFNPGRAPDIARVADVNLMSSSDDQLAIDYDIEKVFTHEQYDPPMYYNDIALLKLRKRPEFIKKLPPLPACIWMRRDYPAEKLLMMGYGAPEFGKNHLGRLFQGNITVIPQQQCINYYNTTVEIPKGVMTSQLCAVDPDGFLDTCEGDSGGPLQFNAEDGLGTPYLVGITSFGQPCLLGIPGVYTRIVDFLGWLEKTLSDNL